MTYNFDTHQYELALVLKNGGYNYQYLFVPLVRQRLLRQEPWVIIGKPKMNMIYTYIIVPSVHNMTVWWEDNFKIRWLCN